MAKVVVTIPAYNEEKSIGQVIKDIHAVLKKEQWKYEILVVDDGSKDHTADVAKKGGAVVYKHTFRRGLSSVFRSEMQQCAKLGADIIVHIDADGQYDAADIPRLIREVEKGADLVLGNRFTGGIEEMPWMKRFGNKAFSRVISNILKVKVGDCQTGFRAFTREVAENIPIISTYTYTQEQIMRAVKENYRVKEIPTHFGRRNHGTSRLMSNPFSYAVKAGINMMRLYRDYEPLKFFGRIGLFFCSLGFAIGVLLVAIFIATGRVGHIPLTILSILLIIMGIQILSIGFLADMLRNFMTGRKK